VRNDPSEQARHASISAANDASAAATSCDVMVAGSIEGDVDRR
jgi:hypothetical protein